MATRQLDLFDETQRFENVRHGDLTSLLASDLDFHDGDSYATHSFHAFPAKYPPQLPAKFISELTAQGDVVLDPMMGSGTTLVEAHLAGRVAVGFDIDPLAVRVARAKTALLDRNQLAKIGVEIVTRARNSLLTDYHTIRQELERIWDDETSAFVNYWFHRDTQIHLRSLTREIERIEDEETKNFFEVVFSAIIITKSGGISLALDLAHTRPHKAKTIFDVDGKIIVNGKNGDTNSHRDNILIKRLRLPIDEFEKRLQKNLANMPSPGRFRLQPRIELGDAQNLPLEDSSVDLIVTSPPYAANAIDYMRAHKFSLVWLGYSVDELSGKRNECIGGEATTRLKREALPAYTETVVKDVASRDTKKGLVLLRYYSEMTRVLRETHRVLRPGKVAIVVVGSSIMRNRDTETGACLADIGKGIGFEVPRIGVRNLDRNRRMMPTGANVDLNSQIQQRMHQEFVIGYVK